MANEPRPLLTAEIVAQYVNPIAKPGKKMGNFKDANGDLWFAYPSDYLRVAPGDTIMVEYTESQGERGMSRFVTKLKLLNGSPPPLPPSPTAAAYAEAAQPVAQNELNPPPVGQPLQQAGQAPLQPAAALQPATGAELQAESIFITGVVGRTMQSGAFSSSDIGLLAKAAVEAWRDRHNIATTEPQNSEEIAF